MNNFSKFNINTNGRTSGRMKTYCPQCHDHRRDKRDKSLSVNLDMGLAYCHYCNWKCNAQPTRQSLQPARQPARQPHPDPRQRRGGKGGTPADSFVGASDGLSPTSLSFGEGRGEAVVEWFSTQRSIPASVLMAAGITSAEEYMPQTGKKELCMCFNYYEGNRLVNTKFRDLNKNFKLVARAELLPYNLNGILGTEECIITEGEIDALSFMTIGRTDVISVPGGANRNLSWMDRFIESHFDDKKVIYISVDSDRKGQELRDELVRRLGAERCRIVDLAPAKDANEVLCMPDGKEILTQALENAPQLPLEGVYGAEDIPDELLAIFENGLGKGAGTGWENLDQQCTFELGRLCVVTGIPGCGKSEFVDELILRLNLHHHWRAAFFSPENMPLSYHLQKLAEKLAGKPFQKGMLSTVQYRAIAEYLQENIVSILPKDDYTVENILAKAQELVRRKGIKLLVIDPFNAFEHRIPVGQSETQYISSFLDQLKNFAIRNGCLVVLVAHPHKMYRNPGTNKMPVPDLYSISGSAAFYNKADFGLVVERNREAGVTRIHIEKVKFKHLGDKGTASFTYNPFNGRFVVCGEKRGLSGNTEFQPQPFDNSSWLPDELQEPGIF